MNTVLSKKLLFAITLTIILFLVYSYRLPQSLQFSSDFGRDIYHTARVAQGDLVLIGSKMNLGGYFVGPYLYYLLAAPILIGNFDINFLLYFHALLFAAALGFFFWVLSQKFGLLKATLAAGSIGLLPIYILSARYPSNGYSYLPLLLILLTFVFFFHTGKKIYLTLLGILTGIIFNIHPTSIFATAFLFLYLFFLLKKRSDIFYFAGAFLLTFLPLIIFELRHNLVMTKDTFVNQSYRTFTEDGSTPQFWLHKNQIISSFLFLSNKFQKLVILPPVFYFGAMLLALSLKWKKKETVSFSYDLFLFLSAILSFILLIASLRFHFEDHYIFSTLFLVVFASIVVITGSKLWWLLSLIILLAVISFPKHLYTPTVRPFEAIGQAVKYTLDQKLITKNEAFNLVQITDAYGLVPVGYEYRFFFRKYGFYPNSEYDYKNAEKLLIFSETPFYDIDRFKMWATEEFGRQYFDKREVYNLGKITIYRISKNNSDPGSE